MRARIAVLLECTIRGYHHYKTIWTAVTGQVLQEEGNHHDPYAVCIKNNYPKKYSRNRRGHVEAIVTGPRKFAYDLEHARTAL